ncbi:MAG: hypothetical protein ABI778_05685, partial [Ignavibacteriota bacterium]
MKKLLCLSLIAALGSVFFFSSCSYEPDSTTPPTATMKFKQGFSGRYDIFIVDTAVNGNNPDHITDSVRHNIEEKIIDTNRTITDGKGVTKSHVAVGVTFVNPAGNPQDSDFFFQDTNGDLYRYNFGFSILNQFPFLTQVIGSRVDVGWVLAAKMTSATGATWEAKSDTVIIASNGIPVYLTSQGQMMADTTFLVGSEIVKARHSRNTVTAMATGGLETGSVILDSYYSTDLNAVICDFFRHVTLSGTLLNQKAQGTY